MFKKLLVAHDGEEACELAFEAALRMAARFGADLIVIHVEPLDVNVEGDNRAVLREREEKHNSFIEDLQQRAQAAGVALTVRSTTGNRTRLIADEALKDGVDLLVLGHNTRSLLSRLFEGTITESVIDKVDCNVLVVRKLSPESA